MIDHVILTVSDLKRSIDFYTPALKSLGYLKTMDFKGEAGHPDLFGFGNDANFSFWLKQGKPDPDSIHIGLQAKNRTEVKAFFDAAIAAGGRSKVEPSVQLQYHPNYYATWVFDPDGYDIEVVNKTGSV
jgi:catechol 2,3-dioxygenase-like lactoylglutathione lyase family enzyme